MMSSTVQRKNYSFYMPDDFTQSLEKIQASDHKIQSLSKSQALYFIISDMASKIKSKEKSKV